MKLKILIHVYGHGKLLVSVFSGEDSFQSSICKILLSLSVTGYTYSHTACEWIKCWIYKGVTHILKCVKVLGGDAASPSLVVWTIGPLLLPGACSVSLSCGGFLVVIYEKYMLSRSCIVSGLPPCSLVF